MAKKQMVHVKVNGREREADVEPRLCWCTSFATVWD